MSSALTPAKYIDKAERALQAARLLDAAGEIEGACNRAYYAMYDAAHAALKVFVTADMQTGDGMNRSAGKWCLSEEVFCRG